MGLPVRRGHASISSRKVRLTRGMEMLHQTAVAIQSMADALDDDFLVAVDKILAMKGCLVVSGMGKAGLIGRKLSATFASTGTRSHFLHPAEAVHGDLGCIGPKDVLLVLSNSGATEEVVRLLPFFSRRAAGLIALTSNAAIT
jgi:arabinose-5-phosphate isomerase